MGFYGFSGRHYIEDIEVTEEVIELAQHYLRDGAVTEKSVDDALHIAVASVFRIDVLASWNFKHIVNINKIHAFHGTNVRLGYPQIDIRNPREILNDPS